jgi:hypothetical protein
MPEEPVVGLIAVSFSLIERLNEMQLSRRFQFSAENGSVNLDLPVDLVS